MNQNVISVNVTCRYPVVPALVEETVLSPSNGLDTLVENQLATDVRVYLFPCSQIDSVGLCVCSLANTTLL